MSGLDCESDAALIRRDFSGMEGIDEVTVFPSSSRVRFVYDSHFTTSTEIEDRLRSLGFPPTKGYPSQPEPWRNPKVLTSLLSGVLLFSGWLFAWTDLPQEVSIISYVFAILIGGYYFGREAVEDLVFERRIGIELLMAVAAIVAAVMGLVSEGAILVFLYSISEAAEGYTEERARSAIKALMNLVPQTVLVRRNGEESEIPLEELQVEDVFIVRPGERVATDGEIVSGTSGVNQAPVTGESAPVEKAPGDTVFAASINGEGVLEIRATKTSADNTVARIIQMVEDAQERKGKSQRFIERFGSRYSPLVLLSGLLIALIPPITMGAAWSVWIERATVFIVAASPCALVISIPITLVATLGKAASNGVLFKGGIHIEQFSKVSVLAFDKTGTLTYGQPKVTDVVPVSDRILGDPNDKNRVLSVAAGVEAHSEHPLARAILTSAKDKGIEPVPSSEFRSLTGSGATAQVEGRKVYIGNLALFESLIDSFETGVRETVESLQDEGKTVVLIGEEDLLWGIIAIRDNLRENVRETVERFHQSGISHVAMLTGDNSRTAKSIAEEAGIDFVYADLKPEDKVARVRELQQEHGFVAMVGDGVNDAPALAEASIGVAMGAAGTDVAMETADVVLMGDDLEKLVHALDLAKRNQKIVHQNLWLSFLVIGVMVLGAVTGAFSLPVAVIGHEVSEFLVIGNGLRMLRG